MLLVELIRRQREEGLTDREFARKLGVSRALWQRTRTEDIEIGGAVRKGAIRAYPELQADVLMSLREEATSQ